MNKIEIMKTEDFLKMWKGKVVILECPKCGNKKIDSYSDETLSIFCPKCRYASSYYQDFIFNPSRRPRI